MHPNLEVITNIVQLSHRRK